MLFRYNEFQLHFLSLQNQLWGFLSGWASSVAYMNAVNNMILRASIKDRQESLDGWNDFDGFKDPSKFGMSVINHPMNYTKQQLDTEIM